jgi:tetratricopeptide (TPR) repeat protein
MLDRLSDAAPTEAAHAAYLLHHFWMAQGAFAEGYERLRGLLARDGLPHQPRAALLAVHRGDTEEAVRLGRQALEEAERLDDAARIWTIGLLATILMGVKRTGEARSLFERCVREARRSGLVGVEIIGLADLGWLDLLEHDYESSRAAYAAALTQLRSRGDKYYEPETLKGLGLASLGLGSVARHAPLSPRCSN